MFFSKCFGFLLLVNIPPVHASIIPGLTGGRTRRHSFAETCSDPMMMTTTTMMMMMVMMMMIAAVVQ